MDDKHIDKYIKDYELDNLTISKGGNFQDFLNRLIDYYKNN